MSSLKSYAVIGHPIGHTMSPFIHARLFALDGIQASYHVIDAPDLSDPSLLSTLRSLDGYNITIPHKQGIIPHLDHLDEKACRFGSVNTVKNSVEGSCGYTTDGSGFLYAIRTGGASLSGQCLLLGSGGAARVLASEVLEAGGVLTIAVRSQSIQKAKTLAQELLARMPGAQVSCITFPELEKGAASYDLLINATSVGMYPKTGASPVSESVVKRCQAVFDAVYNPEHTLLLRYAEKNGIRAIGGMAMLVGQAAAAHEIWSGASYAPEDIERLCQDASAEMERQFAHRGNIILCGFMGCGKTTIGRYIAELSGRKFLDMDDYIEKRAGMEIRDIFETMGEEGFRRMEAEASKELSERNGLVIASGGGTLLAPENREAFRKNGTIILLDVSAAALKERLKNDSARPLLQKPDRDAVIDRLLAERMPQYREAADLIIDANMPPKPVAKRVLAKLGEADET